METIITLLDEFAKQLKEGVQKTDLRDIVQALDARTMQALNSLGYNPAKKPSAIADAIYQEQLSQAKLTAADMDANPIVTLPGAVCAMANSIIVQIRKDLLAFATDFQYTGVMSFRISFLSFGPKMLLNSKNGASGKTAGEVKMANMKAQGYVFAERKPPHGPALADCDQNRKLLSAYTKEQFGTDRVEFMSRNGIMHYMKVVMSPDNYAIIKFPKPPKREPSEAVTADELDRLTRLISSYKDGITAYPVMGDPNMMLGLYSSYVYEIEQVTGIHGAIWEQEEARCKPVRKMNEEILGIQNGYADKAFLALQKQGRQLMSQAKNGLEVMMGYLGLYPLEFKILGGEVVEIKLCVSDFVEDPSKLLLKVEADPICPTDIYIPHTQENIDTIISQARFIMPGCVLAGIETVFRDGQENIKTVTITTDQPSDLKGLLTVAAPK